MKRKIYFLLLIIFLSSFLFSAYKLISWNKDSKILKEEYKEIIEKVEIKEKEIKPEELSLDEDIYRSFSKVSLLDIDLRELKKENADLKGWIKIKSTNINYPFLQTSDNEYYLKRSFKKEYNSAGWLFMDYRNADFKNQNTIIYAHGRYDGTMFGTLKNTLTKDWYLNKDNHLINIVTEDESRLALVFSVYKIKTTSDYLEIDFKEAEFLDFIKMIQKRSVHKFDYQIINEDKIITLSTCANSKEKIVMHAKLLDS